MREYPVAMVLLGKFFVAFPEKNPKKHIFSCFKENLSLNWILYIQISRKAVFQIFENIDNFLWGLAPWWKKNPFNPFWNSEIVFYALFVGGHYFVHYFHIRLHFLHFLSKNYFVFLGFLPFFLLCFFFFFLNFFLFF